MSNRITSLIESIRELAEVTARQEAYIKSLLTSRGFTSVDDLLTKHKIPGARKGRLGTKGASAVIDFLKGLPAGTRIAPPPVTDKQMKFLSALLKERGFKDVEDYWRKRGIRPQELSSSLASKLISDVKGLAPIGRVRSVQKRPPASSGRPASPRQIQYALKLLRRTSQSDWHDTDFGQGMGMPSADEISGWSARDISALIDDLQSLHR